MMTLDAGRTALLELLSDYQQRWPDEHQTIDTFIRFVASTPECFERTWLAGHVTASAWVVDPTSTHVLLLHHAKLAKWMQPGGHADGNPDVMAVARQEVLEEAGLDKLHLAFSGIFDLDIHAIPQRGSVGEHLHYDVRFAFRSTSAAIVGNHESTALAWIPFHNLNQVTQEQSILRMAKKWLMAFADSVDPS